MGVMRFVRPVAAKNGKPHGLEIEYKLLRSKKSNPAKDVDRK